VSHVDKRTGDRWKKKKRIAAPKKQTANWKRNKELAVYAGISEMTLWRWKQLPGFPAAARINGIEYNNVQKFDAWMQKQEKQVRSQRTWLHEGRTRSQEVPESAV
jgi:hypothetical protein